MEGIESSLPPIIIVMNNDVEHIQVAFHNTAKDVFQMAVVEFEHASDLLDRRKEEYRFSQLKQQHVNTLKQHLENAAKSILQDYRLNRQLRKIDQTLQHIIHDYLHRFVIKTREI